MLKTAQILRRFAFEEWGGTETVVWNSVQALEKYGVEGEIIATKALSATADEIRNGIAIRRLNYFYPYFPMRAKLRETLDKKGGNPIVPGLPETLSSGGFELLHLHTGGRVGAMAARWAAKNRLPYVMSFHGGCLDVPEEEMRNMLQPLRGKAPYGGVLDRIFGWRLDPLSGAAGLICVGENELEPLRAKYPRQKVIYLPNGVDAERFARKPESNLRQRLNIAPSRRILLCVSRIDYQKDQKTLVRALAMLRSRGDDYHLLLIGPPSSPWYYGELRELIRSENLEAFVTVVPGVTADDPLLAEAYAEAEVFVLPSRHEPFGIVILEAWSAGRAVVASRVGGAGRLVRDGVDGLQFTPGDAEELAARIELLQNAELRERLGAAGRRTVLTGYTWEIIAGRLAEFYREVLAEAKK